MNEFTKEELEQLSIDMTANILKFGRNGCSEEYIALRDKIQSMIDNYCDHEWDDQCSPECYDGCCGGGLYNIKCEKCGEFLMKDRNDDSQRNN